MKCPLLVVEDIRCHDNQLTDTSDCLMAQCAWWEEHFGKCSIAVKAYLKGVADRSLEVKETTTTWSPHGM